MKKAFASAVIAALSVLAAALAAHAPLIGDFVAAFSLKTLDRQFSIYADPSKADRRIVLIEVDQASLDYFEKDNISFPWPRSMYNPVIEYCAKGGARWVLFDILFNNSLQYGPEDDESFAGAIRGAGNVALAAAFTGGEGQLGGRHEGLEKFGSKVEGAYPLSVTRASVSLPLPEIMDAAKGIGSVTYKPDIDGVYRRVAPAAVYGGRAYPGLFAAPVITADSSVRFTEQGMRVSGEDIPLDDEGFMLINYHGPRGTYRRYSAAAVIVSAIREKNGEKPLIPSSEFKDAYVIVGYTAPGLFDLKPTPLSEQSPGMEIHAAAMDTMLNGKFLMPAPDYWTYTAAFAGALAVSAPVIFLTSSTASGALSLAAVILLFVVSGAAFTHGMWMSLVTLETPVILSLLASAGYKYQTEGKQKRFIQSAFSHYVSPNVVERIVADPSTLKLGGEKREITVFFCDLEGFTTISERLAPADLVALLNEYTTLMADAITAREGVVDKYIGDAVMAFWGAPLAMRDHAVAACLAAMDCMSALEGFNRTLASRGLPPVNVRIGLNTGECVVGNMGSRDRFDYTAIGDTVNQASRLEGLNKVYGANILAAEPTWIAAKEKVFGRRIDYLKVKGKDIAVWAYEIMAPKGEETDRQRKIAEEYEKALIAYLDRDWETAIHLTGALVLEFGDGPSGTLNGRARLYAQSPPPDGWDGAFTHTSK